jgi:hypothetical protein
MLLIGCGFHASNPADPDAKPAGDDAAPDVPPVGQETVCSSIMLGDPLFRASACGTTVAAAIEISGNVLLNTDQGTSNTPGISCAIVTNLNSHVCAVVAGTILIKVGATLAAIGSNPLALFAHSIRVQGKIDVASHAGGVVGAGSFRGGCNNGDGPTAGGGGGGGAIADSGGDGGDEGGVPGSGGKGGNSFGINALTGGCAGLPGGHGVAGDSGSGGGAVWIATDTGALTFEATAIVNASGAGGLGGATDGHGGSGGGSGGLIVLQAETLHATGAQIFANGGGGGGGAGTNAGTIDNTRGTNGGDPMGPALGGGGGTGGLDGTGLLLAGAMTGNGGYGFPSTMPMRGQDGGGGGRGGGGGGGGPGAIRVVSSMHIDGPNVSPPPVYLQ